MSKTLPRSVLVRAVASLLVLIVAAMAFGAVVHPATASPKMPQYVGPPVSLVATATWNDDGFPQQRFHLGGYVHLETVLYTHLTGWHTVTQTISVYRGAYHLYDYTGKVDVPPDVDYHGMSRPPIQVPANAPLGTYQFVYTLHQSGFDDETITFTFSVAK